MDDPRPVVLYIVGYEWADGCRMASTLLTAEEAMALANTGDGWIVMPDRASMEAQARWDQLHDPKRRRFSSW